MAEIDRRKAALIAELEISRGEIRSATRACEESFNIVSILRRNVVNHAKVWLPSAVLGGWVLSKLLGSRRGSGGTAPKASREERSSSKAGMWALLAAAGKISLDFARPALIEMVTDWLHRTDFSFISKSRKTPPSSVAPSHERDANRNGASHSQPTPRA